MQKFRIEEKEEKENNGILFDGLVIALRKEEANNQRSDKSSLGRKRTESQFRDKENKKKIVSCKVLLFFKENRSTVVEDEDEEKYK